MQAVPIINNKICPANILANNRIAKLKGRMQKESISITTNKVLTN